MARVRRADNDGGWMLAAVGGQWAATAVGANMEGRRAACRAGRGTPMPVVAATVCRRRAVSSERVAAAGRVGELGVVAIDCDDRP